MLILIDLVSFRPLALARPGAVALLLCLGACVSGATPGAMTAPLSEQTMLRAESRMRQAVAVGTVAGGRETNPLWMSQVSNPDFATALRQSLSIHAMLARDGEAFRLEATLSPLQQPLMGASMTVRANVQYRLTHVATGAIAFERDIDAAYTAAFDAVFSGAERLRLANEGAIRENIRQFLLALIAEEARNPGAFGAAAPRIS